MVSFADIDVDVDVRRLALPPTTVREVYRSPDPTVNMFMRVTLRRIGGPGFGRVKRDTAGLLLHGGGTGGLGGTIGGGLADTDANADADADAAAPPPPPPPHVEPLSTLAGDSHVTIMRWDQKLFSPQEVERLRDLGELAVRGESRLTQLERAYINELHVLEGEATRSKVFEGSVIYTYIHDDIQVQRRHLARPIVSESGLRENYTDLSKGVLDIDGFKLARLGVTDGVLQQENAGGTRVRAAVPSELRSVAEQDDDILEEGAAAGGSRGRRGGGGGGGGSAADAGDGASVALRTTTEALDALDGSGTYQATASGGETSGGSSFSVLRWFKRLVTSHQFEGMAGSRGLVSYAKVQQAGICAAASGSMPARQKTVRVMELCAAVDLPTVVRRSVRDSLRESMQEVSLCIVRVYGDGTFDTMPPLSHNVQDTRRFVSAKGDIWEYAVQLMTDPPLGSTQSQRLRVETAQKDTRKVELRTSLVGTFFQPAPSYDAFVRLLIRGTLLRGLNFPTRSPYCIHLVVVVPGKWSDVGAYGPSTAGCGKQLRYVTQRALAKTIVLPGAYGERVEQDVAHIGFPLEWEFIADWKSLAPVSGDDSSPRARGDDGGCEEGAAAAAATGEQGTGGGAGAVDPDVAVMYMQVVEVDRWDRNRLVGLSSMPLPTVPGMHRTRVATWKPRSTVREAVGDAFVGGVFELEDMAAMATPTGHRHRILNKYGLSTEPSGSLEFEFHVATQSEVAALRYHHAHVEGPAGLKLRTAPRSTVSLQSRATLLRVLRKLNKSSTSAHTGVATDFRGF